MMDAKVECRRRLESALAALDDALYYAKLREIADISDIAISIDEAAADVRPLVAKARAL